MNKILIGTGNEAKIKTYKNLLKDFNLEVVSAKDLNIPEPDENAKSFEEEAVKKAQYYFEKSGIPTIVDDGGFQIEALNGEPGIRSRRWIGREMTDEEIISEVMNRLKDVPPEKRNAQHTIVMAVACPFGIFTAHGQIAGIVADKPCEKRIKRFPYRSVLYLPNYHKYWVELSEDEEEILNHRKHALEKIKDIIQELSK